MEGVTSLINYFLGLEREDLDSWGVGEVVPSIFPIGPEGGRDGIPFVSSGH